MKEEAGVKRWKRGLVIYTAGLIGVLSLLTMQFSLPEETKEILETQFTPTQIKLLTIINPAIILLIAVLVGTFLLDKTKLKTPLIDGLISNKKPVFYFSIALYGVGLGLLSGLFLSIISLIYEPYLPAEFLELSEKVVPTIWSRFLYGGITEEVLMRYGLMTFLIWLVSRFQSEPNKLTYWLSILLAALVFAIGHFPVAFQTIENPSIGLLSYILLGNSVGGIIFGWLYWKKGLSAAFIAHIFTHVVLLLFSF